MNDTDTTEMPDPVQPQEGSESLEELEQELEAEQGVQRGRKRMLILLLILLLLLCGASGLAYRYLTSPAPLPELVIPDADIHYAPHYLFSIYGLEKPVGVTVSSRGDRIFVTESGGERLVKVFDRGGELINSFAPPGTVSGERSPVYLAIDGFGRLYVTDRMQHAIYVYDSGGNFLDLSSHSSGKHRGKPDGHGLGANAKLLCHSPQIAVVVRQIECGLPKGVSNSI